MAAFVRGSWTQCTCARRLWDTIAVTGQSEKRLGSRHPVHFSCTLDLPVPLPIDPRRHSPRRLSAPETHSLALLCQHLLCQLPASLRALPQSHRTPPRPPPPAPHRPPPLHHFAAMASLAVKALKPILPPCFHSQKVGVVVSAGKMAGAVKVRVAEQEWNKKFRKVSCPPNTSPRNHPPCTQPTHM